MFCFILPFWIEYMQAILLLFIWSNSPCGYFLFESSLIKLSFVDNNLPTFITGHFESHCWFWWISPKREIILALSLFHPPSLPISWEKYHSFRQEAIISDNISWFNDHDCCMLWCKLEISILATCWVYL